MFETLPSTSRWLADRPLDQTTLAVADEQTRGRGRQGREWQSPSGGIYFSVGLPMDPGVSVPDGLSLVMGLQLAEALTAAGFAGIALKWPNDLVVDDAKLAGLLVERLPNALIVGVGVNTRPVPEGAVVAGRRVISLRELADRPTGDALIGTLAGAVLTVTTWTATQVERLLETRWPVFDALANRVVIAEQADGTRRQGRVLGVTAAGNLRLQTDTGEHRLAAGECHIGPHTGAAS
ncbi:biotin--[acetyl-CoA-carboxylase] ligase [Spiribacter roseus]|uniref:biotin--[acetyl-CoA-carboxylase] ligase n=1 Tax=Spiribacter roseus TaxID=1855875 RepID=UPI0012FD8B76